MTDTTVSAARTALGLTEESRQEAEERAARERAAQQQADRHAAELDRLAAERAAAEQADQQRARGQLATVMREIREQIDGARTTAMQAVREGTDPVGAWTRYRLTAAEARGRWEGFVTTFQAATGQTAPPGPTYPPLDKEGLTEFLALTLRAAEAEARQAANRGMQEELGASRIADEARQRRRTEKAAERAARAAMEAAGKEPPPDPKAGHREWVAYAERAHGANAMTLGSVSRDELVERYGLMADETARRAAREVLDGA
ncbi:hypothetical protein AB0H37_14665 [Actinomadura sp. NPDC023710]|uniref:hypothetical protein n=1 Tax=Actinomadura sp. NPDC023710 TaxID=3158219 RepID=UPI00340FDFCA